jgi:acyl-CoA dehydrogenase
MDFDLSDDQVALREAAADLLDGLASPARVRTHSEGTDLFDAVLWAAMVEQGWLGVELAEESGGLGLGAVEVAVLLEEVGRHVAPAPFRSTVLAIDACARAGRDDAVTPLLSGDHRACVAWSRRADAVTAAADGDTWTLTGRPDPVVDAPGADLAIVPALAPDGPALFAVSLREHGRPSRESAMDLTRALGWLHLDHTPAERLGGAEAVDALLDRGCAFTAAEMLGSASRVLEMATDYAKERVQFGRPIADNQAIQFYLADSATELDAARLLIRRAAWLKDQGRRTTRESSIAKLWAAQAGMRACDRAIQIHGGYGYTREFPVERALRDCKLCEIGEGTNEVQRLVIAREILGRA